MRHLRPFPLLIAIAIIGAACSGPGASSGGDQSQAAGASDGAGASQPAASTGGGGGGGGIFGNGSAKYHITGDYTADGELSFIPAASQIQQDSYSLSFSDQDSNTVIVILISGGTEVLSYGDEGHTIPGATCDFNITRQDSDGAAGTFTCNDQPLFNTVDSTTGSADISGEFDARK